MGLFIYGIFMFIFCSRPLKHLRVMMSSSRLLGIILTSGMYYLNLIYWEFIESPKNIIWLDAGCLITRNLKLLKSIIKKNGFYSPQSSDTIKRWTHPQTLKALDTNEKVYKKRNVSGGIVGFAINSEKMKDLLLDWNEFSLRKEVIAPKGSNRLNHRQDQAILSVLIHQHGVSRLTPRTHKIFGILRHQDNENFKYIKWNFSSTIFNILMKLASQYFYNIHKNEISKYIKSDTEY